VASLQRGLEVREFANSEIFLVEREAYISKQLFRITEMIDRKELFAIAYHRFNLKSDVESLNERMMASLLYTISF
jgi:hypothetical protein